MSEGRYQKTIAVMLTVIAVLLLFSEISEISSAILALVLTVRPVLAGLSLAFVLNVPMSALERLWGRLIRQAGKRALLGRVVCLLVCLVGAVGAIVLFFLLITPRVLQSLSSLLSAAPQLLDHATALWERACEWAAKHSIELPPLALDLDRLISAAQSQLLDNTRSIVSASIGVISSIFRGVINAVLSLAIAIYVLLKKEKLAEQTKRLLCAALPARMGERVLFVARLTSSAFSRFITGQVAEASVLGVLCLVGMLAFGFPYAALISFVVGVTALIPVLGAFFGIAVGALLILLAEPAKAVWFLVYMIVLQQLETNLIYPRVVARSVGVPALWVLIAVTVGAGFGVLGMLVAVPAFSVLYALLRQYVICAEQGSRKKRE